MSRVVTGQRPVTNCSPRSRWRIVGSIILLGAWAVPPGRAEAYSPESPEVVAMIERGLAAIEKDGGKNTRLGAKCITAYALVKNGKPTTHPLVQAAIQAAVDNLKNEESPYANHERSIYDIALALIMLCEVAPQAQNDAIIKYLDILQKAQHPNGPWNYAGSTDFGDVSQTQYGMLALWTADFHGFPISIKSAELCTTWLVRVQDPSGGFPYRGFDPGNYTRNPQSGVQNSVSAAGVGSLYVAADLLALSSAEASGAGKDELPPALRVVKREKGGRIVKPAVPQDPFTNAQREGNRYFAEKGSITVPLWQHYYLYALERYRSFQELAEGGNDDEPDWYNQGVEFLQSTQNGTGGWPVSSTTLDNDFNYSVDAALAVLFLCRSTKKAIEEKVQQAGTLLGGRGLPGDTTNVRIKNGRVVALDVTKSLDDLVDLLEGDENEAEISSLVFSSDDLNITSDKPLDAKQSGRLRRLAAHPDYQVRILAVKAIARTDNLDIAPTLIYALSDPDWRVVKQADQGMRLLSRRIEGFGFPEDGDSAGRAELIRAWKTWFGSIRPGGFTMTAQEEPKPPAAKK